MSWPAFVNRMLEATNKVEKVAVFNSDGVPLTVTEDLSVSKLEGEALMRALTDPAHSIAKIHIDNADYTCFQGNQRTLLGNNKSKGKTFVAYTAKDCIIIVLGQSQGHGSFIFELKRNLYMWDKPKDQNQPKPKVRQSQGGEAINRKAPVSEEGDLLLNMEDDDLMSSTPNELTVSDEDILLDLSNQQHSSA